VAVHTARHTRWRCRLRKIDNALALLAAHGPITAALLGSAYVFGEQFVPEKPWDLPSLVLFVFYKPFGRFQVMMVLAMTIFHFVMMLCADKSLRASPKFVIAVIGNAGVMASIAIILAHREAGLWIWGPMIGLCAALTWIFRRHFGDRLLV
jgi:hypothetical protein